MKEAEKENQIDENLLEEVLKDTNLRAALKRVRSNKGSPGVDGMTTEELPKFLKDNWLSIKERLLTGRYKPAPVRRVEIPKPNGGVRQLGIPTVLDRFIQQALMQVLQRRWDKTFSENSFGFRPGKSAHMAVAQARKYVKLGYSWVIDIDLEKFFDKVNHDRLMSKCADRIEDKRILKLISSYLKVGVMENGITTPAFEGTPQGGPLSPLLSNLVLDELDQELTRKGLRFVRYADDCNTYVKSKRAGKRVMESITDFITNTLKLKVNAQKSAVDRPWNRKVLGFSLVMVRSKVKIKPAPSSMVRFKDKIREITKRSNGRSMEQVIRKLTPYIIGWRNYFGISEVKSAFKGLDSWIRRKLRCMIWKQWGKRQYRELRAGGIECFTAWVTAKSGHGPWRISQSPAVQRVLNYKFFEKLNLPLLIEIKVTR